MDCGFFVYVQAVLRYGCPIFSVYTNWTRNDFYLANRYALIQSWRAMKFSVFLFTVYFPCAQELKNGGTCHIYKIEPATLGILVRAQVSILEG